MGNQDIRWHQRFSNYQKALGKLEEVVNQATHNELSELEKEGMIQRFEYTYELAWKTLQDLFKNKGFLELIGPNPVISQAFKDGIIKDGEGWKRMKKSRELTSHTYDSGTAEDIAESIIDNYYDLLKMLEATLVREMKSNQTGLF